MDLLGDMGHVETSFGPSRDGVVSVQSRCTVCTKCNIGLGIILAETAGTPR
jgi:hypothetical protein